MNTQREPGSPDSPAPPSGASVFDLDLRRIERALSHRTRYKYVHPRVEREGAGWKLVAPNCSRKIDAQGRDINIASFQPDSQGHWQLYARDHAAQCWRLKHSGLTLTQALEQVCVDVDREFWQ